MVRVCPQCAHHNPDSARRCERCAAALINVPMVSEAEARTATTRAEAPRQGLRGIAFSVAGAALAVAVWIGLSYATDRELNLLVLLVGAAAGFGMLYGAGRSIDVSTGVFAALITVGGLFAEKFVLTRLQFADIRNQIVAQTARPGAQIAEFASALLLERMAEDGADDGGMDVGPSFVSSDGDTDPADDADSADDVPYDHSRDFPPEIWAEATAHWDALGGDEQQRRIAADVAVVEEGLDEVYAQHGGMFVFLRSIWGILWTASGVALAFRLGSSGTWKKS